MLLPLNGLAHIRNRGGNLEWPVKFARRSDAVAFSVALRALKDETPAHCRASRFPKGSASFRVQGQRCSDPMAARRMIPTTVRNLRKKSLRTGVSSGRYLSWSVGVAKRFKRAAMKSEGLLAGYSRSKWGSGCACFVADRFDRVASCSRGQLHIEIRARADVPAGGRSGGNDRSGFGGLPAGRTRRAQQARAGIGPNTTRHRRSQCAGFAALDRAPSYVELLTCLEMAKQAQELPPDSKADTVGRK